MRRSSGKAKVVGTVLGVGGAMVLTLYRGTNIKLWSTNIDLLRHYEASRNSSPVQQNLVSGSALALCSCISYAGWLIIQVINSLMFLSRQLSVPKIEVSKNRTKK